MPTPRHAAPLSPPLRSLAAAREETKVEINEQHAVHNFQQNFSQLANHISALGGNTEDLNSKINTFAHKLNQEDINKLSEIINDSHAEGDQRSMAIELLSTTNNNSALTYLTKFVAEYRDSTATEWDRAQEFEVVLRAQAIEGIAAFADESQAIQQLAFLQKHTNNTFLRDRILRSLNALSGSAPTARDQDLAALALLLR